MRGVLFTRGWGKVKLSPDTWDWDAFDKQVQWRKGLLSNWLLSQLRDAAELDLGIGVRFYTGSAAPHWLYDVGVPEIKLEGSTEDSYPYYPDPIYKEYYYRLDVRYSPTRTTL